MHRRIFQLLSVLSMVAILGACGEPSVTHKLELTDQSGTVVATLVVVLPSSLPADGKEFKGSWQLVSYTSGFPVDAVQSGRYLALQQDGRLLLDLNPGWADSNVVLDTAAQSKQMTGSWRRATAAGFQPGGSIRSLQ
jgi:hypothetical protein